MLGVAGRENADPMPKAGSAKKRSYMASHERRRTLLDAATRIVGRSGWSALTMKGLAAEAGVSRQLVYDHFEDGSGLLLSSIAHLFQEFHRATAEVLKESSGDVSSTVREAYRIFLELPAAERRALRAISGDFVPDRPETREAIALMREQIFALWVPFVRREVGLPERELRPIVWMLNAAAWALADLVDDGTVGRDEAMGMLASLAGHAVVQRRAPGRRRKSAASTPPRRRRRKGGPDD